MFHSIWGQFPLNFDKFRDIAPLIQSRHGIRLGSSALRTFFNTGYPIFTPVSVASLADLLRHISQPAILMFTLTTSIRSGRRDCYGSISFSFNSCSELTRKLFDLFGVSLPRAFC